MLPFLLLSLVSLALAQPWMDKVASPGERAQLLLDQMTLDEKLSMVHGYGGPYVGNVPALPRLKIPALRLEDGPQGVADGVKLTTCWPSALTVVATWDVDRMLEWGQAMGAEQRIKGTNIALGPMVNIARVPEDGRNFESMGEDPHLSSRMAVHVIKGVQSQGVMGCVKHWAANNQEYHRTSVSANVDKRTLHEIYFPAFKAAILEAGVGSVMCSYNRVNSTYACENEYTLNTVMKQMWGYKGFVMSDWGATHSTVPAANNGLDMQMPDASYFGAALAAAVQSGKVSKARVDDMVLRILTSMFAVGIFDEPQTGALGDDSRSVAHNILARRIAAEATVLLQNKNGLLPLNITSGKWKKIAVIGDDGRDKPVYAGGGSGHVDASYVITPYQGIVTRVEKNANVTYAPSNPLSNVQKVAQEADVAIVFVEAWSSEGMDRTNLDLPNNQDALVAAVAKVQKNTIVVIHSPGAVTMPWASSVDSILAALMPGQEDGNAIARVLFGDVNPSARLPVTFPVTSAQTPLKTPEQYPGVNDQEYYSEKLLVGYRWYDAVSQTPLFPFGHGLSYTTFSYANLSVREEGFAVVVEFDISNDGKVKGSEVPQLYLGFPSSAGEPPQQLKGFKKVKDLAPGEVAHVHFELKEADLSIFNENTESWQAVTGLFTVHVGASSRDIRLMGQFTW